MAKSLADGFEAFLGSLVPLPTEHRKGYAHKASVFSCLEKTFGCFQLLETGSFGNGTGVRHWSDTDYFAVCKTGVLGQNSKMTLRDVKQALRATFWNTPSIVVDSPAVRIPFGSFASEDIEVVPCDFQGMIETPLGKKPVYEIPDGRGGWMYASPSAHNAYVKQQDQRLGGKLKPLIRLLKAWKFYNAVPISSFYLELRATRYVELDPEIIYDLDLMSIVQRLAETRLAGIRDPMGVSGVVPPCNRGAKWISSLSKLATARSRAEKAVAHREKNLDRCFGYWNLFFNGRFPAR